MARRGTDRGSLAQGSGRERLLTLPLTGGDCDASVLIFELPLWETGWFAVLREVVVGPA